NRFFSDDHFFSGFLYIQYSLVHDAASVLDELSHGVKICCQIHRRREDTFLVFSFAFSIELFPPLGYIVETWLIVCKYFHCFSFCVKNISNCCILKCIVFLKWKLQRCLSSGCCSFHKLCNVSSACCDRQKSYRCQNRETSSHIIRNYKGLISFFCSKIFQCSSCLVCRSVDTLCCFLFSVFLFQHLFENAERDRRFSSRTGFRNNIYRKISVSDHFNQIMKIGAADAVSYKVNLRRLTCLFGNIIIETMS